MIHNPKRPFAVMMYQFKVYWKDGTASDEELCEPLDKDLTEASSSELEAWAITQGQFMDARHLEYKGYYCV